MTQKTRLIFLEKNLEKLQLALHAKRQLSKMSVQYIFSNKDDSHTYVNVTYEITIKNYSLVHAYENSHLFLDMQRKLENILKQRKV